MYSRSAWPSLRLLLLSVYAALVAHAACAGDQPQWGERHTRNMVSPETGLPTAFDPKTNDHILWSAPLGGNAYASPVVAAGKVFIGANNAQPRNPRHIGDKAILLCLNEKDGALCWQLAVPRIGGDKFLDWPEIGMCSPPTVEGDRVYMVTNRDEVVCLDINGLANGNDGPYQDEARHMTESDQPPMDLDPTDADILWMFDMKTEVGVYPHDGAHVSILIDGDHLYMNTTNGVDNTHAVIRKPDAPSLIALDKNTGKLLAVDAEKIGPRIFHATWSSPAMGTVNGKKLVFLGGADGVCYAFRALPPIAPNKVSTFERVWRFDCDPKAPKTDIHSYLKNIKESPSSILGMPVFHNNRLYVAVGGDIWWGKRFAWLKCIDATKTGDITDNGEIWSRPLERYTSATPAIANGLIFVTDCAGKVHCVDAESGQELWVHDMGKEIWGSTLVADGKVYVGARNGALAVLAAERTRQVLATVQLPDEIAGTPTAANGVLYVSTLSTLYAVK